MTNLTRLLLGTLLAVPITPLAAAAATSTTTTTTTTHTAHHPAAKVTTRTTTHTATRHGAGGTVTHTTTHSTSSVNGNTLGHSTTHSTTRTVPPTAHAPAHAATHTAAKSSVRHANPPRAVVRATPPPPPAAAPAPAPVVAAAPPPDPAKGSATGLPIPRFAALRSDQVSLRAGPGTRYPIDWIYQRRDLPVKIEREFEAWRLVSQPDGTKGWVHQAMLTGRRGLLVVGDTPQTLRGGPADSAAAVAILKPGVVGRLINCQPAATACQVQVKTYKGWLNRDAFWGSLPNEAVGP